MRADKFFAEKFGSRTKSAEAIEKGLVLVNGKAIKPKTEILETDQITFIQPKESFVSNGGYKLDRAIQTFQISCKDKVFVDIGASTGGFTDCLLQNGAKFVYAADVGHFAGLGNEFEIQALVDGEYITVGKGFTCAEGKDYVTVYAIDSVKTTDIRILMTNTAVYIPTILEVEIYSNTDKVDPFVGHVISEKVPEVTVFKTETPRFDVAGLPN